MTTARTSVARSLERLMDAVLQGQAEQTRGLRAYSSESAHGLRAYYCSASPLPLSPFSLLSHVRDCSLVLRLDLELLVSDVMLNLIRYKLRNGHDWWRGRK